MSLRKERVRPVGRAFAGRRLGVILATAGVLALSLTSVVVASPSNAAPFTWSFENSAGAADLCLTSFGAYDGYAKVWTCNSSSNQHWHYGGLHGAYAQIINGDGQCLGVSNGSNSAGAHVIMWSCNGADSQYWLPENNFPGVIDFLNQNSQMVIELTCHCYANGSDLYQEPYYVFGSPWQLWYPQSF